MQIDYQKKYFQLKNLSKKQEATIAKLQAEIRERCQSYLLYSSRNKKPAMPEDNGPSSLTNQQFNQPSCSSTISLVEPYGASSEYRSPQMLQKMVGTDEQLKIKNPNLAISSQFSIFQQASPITKNKKEYQEQACESIIQSYKQRIRKAQQQKNKEIRIAEKLTSQLNQAKAKVVDLQRKMEVLSKSEKNLKQKMSKMTQFEDNIHQIYDELYQKLEFQGQKAIEFDEIDSFSQRIQFILQLIKETTAFEGAKMQKNASLQNSAEEAANSSNSSENTSKSSIEASVQKTRGKRQKIAVHSSADMSKGIKIQKSENSINAVSDFSPVQRKHEIAQQINDLKTYYEGQISELNQQYKKQIDEMKECYETQNANLKYLFERQIEAHQAFSEEAKNLRKESAQKSNSISRLSLQLSNTKEELLQSRSKLFQSQSEISRFKEDSSNVKNQEQTKEELDKSRSIIDELSYSKLQKQKMNSTEKPAQQQSNLTIKVPETLEQPYYIEEQLYHDPNDTYVKRNFLRKKIVRRNFSATAYRVLSRSKEEVDSLIHSKIHGYTDKSLEKIEKLKEGVSNKKVERKGREANPRISQLSEQNRESGYMGEEVDLVKIVEVTTKTPREEVNTKKIYSKRGQQIFSVRRGGQ